MRAQMYYYVLLEMRLNRPWRRVSVRFSLSSQADEKAAMSTTATPDITADQQRITPTTPGSAYLLRRAIRRLRNLDLVRNMFVRI